MPPRGIRLEGVEKELLVRALGKFNGNQTHAAQYLDISRKALRYRMEKYGIPKEGTEEDDENSLGDLAWNDK